MLTKKYIIGDVAFYCGKPNAVQLVKYSREVSEALKLNNDEAIASVKVNAALLLVTKAEVESEKIEVSELKENYSAELFILSTNIYDKCFVQVEAENPLAEK